MTLKWGGVTVEDVAISEMSSANGRLPDFDEILVEEVVL